MTRIKTHGLPLVVAAGVLALTAPNAATAACHIAAFETTSVQVNEGAGQATLTVELVGGNPTCAGTVDYQTANGSAVAGQDYTARQGTLTFTAGDDRKESFSIPITNDAADEPSQQFTVRLSNGTGSLTADETPATVTIADNDPAPAATSSSPAPKTTRSASPSPRTSASPTSSSPSPSPTAAATSTSPTPTETVQAAPSAPSDGTSAGLILAIIAGVLALAGLGLGLRLRLRRR